jgi:hypothetical protein
MVVATSKGLMKLASNFIIPGGSFILKLLDVLNQIISLGAAVADFIISKIKCADSLLTRNPITLEIQI